MLGRKFKKAVKMIKSMFFFWKCKVLLQSLITALLSFQVLATFLTPGFPLYQVYLGKTSEV